MVFSSVIRTISQSPLTTELQQKLHEKNSLKLAGIGRLAKGLIASSLAQSQSQNLCIVCATIEEASRWAIQLEAMGWQSVHFYPTSEASPYEGLSPESEMVWGQMQVLSGILPTTVKTSDAQGKNAKFALVTTEKALQTHLPPPEVFQDYCLHLRPGISKESKEVDQTFARLGYQRVPLVETEGQWSRRGDIVDIFPVAAELPLRLEWFGDELERLREFDPATQRSLEKIESLMLTPTNFSFLIAQTLKETNRDSSAYLNENEKEELENNGFSSGIQRLLSLAFPSPASLLDYLAQDTLLTFDEVEQCQAHCENWLSYVSEQWEELQPVDFSPLHRSFEACCQQAQDFPLLYLGELAESTDDEALDLSGRPLPLTPHQFAKSAEILRGKREIYTSINLRNYATWLISAQPSRTVSLLQEHDCAAQFIPNPQDYPAIEKHQLQKSAIALRYSGLAELEGFILPTFRIAIVTDRELFGQHALATPSYIRKRRRATSKKVDLNQLKPKDYVVHRNHGIGQFIKLEALATRDYLVIKYADGLLRVPADSVDSLSRYQKSGNRPPELHKMSGKVWEKTKNKVRKSVKKIAFDLLNLYAQRAEQSGYIFPPDSPWQQELEESFPYQPTPDQLKAVQDVKRDLESDRPMDRLVCGDVGFGKTEVAIRAIFKAITTANKQVALLAPTTILTQQHYHTLKERFSPYPINIGLLNRFRTATEKKEILQRLAVGELDVVVGTHQLLGKTVKFKNLGLLVIDEEQRFGVNQKEKIKSLKTQVDVLTLTATPIPRTLYISLSGIREMSLISTPPPSRRPIKTHLSPYNPDAIRTAIRNELDRGGQVFYVVPRVEGIEEVAGQLHQMIPSARIAIGHGQMDESSLEATMLAFNNAEADILVCTTIIESGLDIPRVNTIIVEDSQKFGLSQLYQLRGRVGRSGIQAHAWLLYPNKGKLSENARRRLRALQEFTQLGSGYQLATRDMEIRGVGNLLGAEQSGQMMAIGFDLYMDMLQEEIREIQGQKIPQVDDCQVDLRLTAFIPESYIPDMEQKMTAYRIIAAATSEKELAQIAADWCDRYGPLPAGVEQLLQVIKLKQIAKSIGFSRVKPEGKQHVVLETPMAEPAWKLLQPHLPKHLQSRFVYSLKKVTVRGLGVIRPQQQLENLVEWLDKIRGGIAETEVN